MWLSENTATCLDMIGWLQAWLLKLMVTDMTVEQAVVKRKQEGQSENQASSFQHL